MHKHKLNWTKGKKIELMYEGLLGTLFRKAHTHKNGSGRAAQNNNSDYI